MNYTLDTAAIRKRFDQAIIGIRQDGTMAVLVPDCNDNSFDLVGGEDYYSEHIHHEFPTLIRPGDRCEVSDDNENWYPVQFRGLSNEWEYPILATEVGVVADYYRTIRPLPAAETKTEQTPTYTMDDFKQGRICADFRHIPESKREAAFRRFLARCGGMKWCDDMAPEAFIPTSGVGCIFNEAEHKGMTYGFGCDRSIPVRPENIMDCPDHAAILSHLAAAEQELAAIRAEMKQVQK